MAANPAETEGRVVLALTKEQPSPTSPRGRTPSSGHRSFSTQQCSPSVRQVAGRSLYPPAVPETEHTIRTCCTPLGGRSIDSGVNYFLGA
jgi:hypothetical protein